MSSSSTQLPPPSLDAANMFSFFSFYQPSTWQETGPGDYQSYFKRSLQSWSSSSSTQRQRVLDGWSPSRETMKLSKFLLDTCVLLSLPLSNLGTALVRLIKPLLQHANGDHQDELVQFEFQEIKDAILSDRTSKSTSWNHLYETCGNRKRLYLCILIGAAGKSATFEGSAGWSSRSFVQADRFPLVSFPFVAKLNSTE